ncbi:hypothetical protein FRC01_003421 [Tulasnella sp. 417]|nr:hypothetical protein FRC01_003421 [Tulasnella sp. 417]
MGGMQASLSCKLSMARRQMRDKYLPVEWDYHGRTYFIGFLEGKQVWFLFQPDDDHPEETVNDSTSGSTSLSTLRQRRFSLFWGSLLQNLPGTNIVVRDIYADCTSDEQYAAATNLMSRNTDDPLLTSHTLSILQGRFEGEYEKWASNAPWGREDPFFAQSTPNLVVYQYGQNKRIFIHESNHPAHAAEVAAFSNEYNWFEVWLFTYAVATTFRAREASSLQASTEVLTARHIYTTRDEETREEVALEDLADAIEQQRCPPIFDEDGDEIQPYEPVFESQHVDCGIVLNLNQVPAEVQAADDDTRHPEYTTYPLAYCRGIGNCQASTHLNFYQRFVNRINRELQEEGGAGIAPVKRGPHQIYNEIAHKTRSRDGLHDSQRGYVTAAVAGKNLRGANLAASHLRCQEACSLQLPSESYHEKLLRAGHYIGLRSEPMITINVQALERHRRNGRFIYDTIMRAGCDIYVEESTWAEVCNLMVVFKPLMWPQILHWSTIPVSAAIKALWDEHESEADALEAPWERIELLCLLERLLVFAQTGNMQVVSGALSDTFGLKHSLETTGYPTFSFALDILGSVPKIREGYWPTRRTDNHAITIANGTLRFHYNESVSQTHTAKATLGLLINRATGPAGADASARTSRLLADHLVEVLLKDMQALVVDKCIAEIGSLRSATSLADRNHAGQRQKYLEDWKRQRHPWGQGTPHTQLMLAVAFGPQDDTHLVASQPGLLTVGELASQIVNCMDPDTCPTTSPLFLTNGAFRVLAATVWGVGLRELQLVAAQLKPQMTHMVTNSLIGKQVCRLPWLVIRQDGRPTRQVGISHWVTIQRTEAATKDTPDLETTAMRQERQAAQVAAMAEDNDPSTPWVAFSGQLSTQKKYLRRVCLPSDLNFALVISTITDPLLKGHLDAICDGFNLRLPAHRLGLRVACLASRLLPSINLEPDGSGGAGPGGSATSAFQNQLKWCSSSRKDPNAGLTDRQAWGSTFTLAWLFYLGTPPGHEIFDSPAYSGFLRKIGMGVKYLLYPLLLTPHQGAKLINSRLFIKLHLATSTHTNSGKLSKGGKFGQDWRCIDEKEIRDLDQFVEGNLEDGNVAAVAEFILGIDGRSILHNSGAF